MNEWIKVVHCNVTHHLYSSNLRPWQQLDPCNTRHISLTRKWGGGGLSFSKSIFLLTYPRIWLFYPCPRPRIHGYQAKQLYRGLICNSLPFLEAKKEELPNLIPSRVRNKHTFLTAKIVYILDWHWNKHILFLKVSCHFFGGSGSCTLIFKTADIKQNTSRGKC